jgi:pimeloyl-ACP methyl ester carboxylesterase
MAGLRRFLIVLTLPLASLILPLTASADGGTRGVGVVLMHGKGGSPTKHVSGLASFLEGQGFLVANVEMPWSGRRNYDVDVGAAELEVESAMAALRAKGAQRVFVAGHSLGGLFALYFGGKHAVDGIIAIAPGGNTASPIYQEKVGDSVARARKLVAEGKGQEKVALSDFEGSRGTYTIVVTPATYLSWFSPDGAMNETAAVRNMNPDVPVLFIVPTNEYPGLLKVKQEMFDALPRNPRTKLYEPNSNHLNAPSASADAIAEWMAAVASGR